LKSEYNGPQIAQYIKKDNANDTDINAKASLKSTNPEEESKRQ
jgi:hypothetical protein